MKTRTARLLLLAILLSISFAACGGENAISSTSVSTIQDVGKEAEALEAAVRAYSEAFLGGNAKEAWQIRTRDAQSGGSYAEFALAVKMAHDIYGDAEMTSLDVSVSGDTARVSYTYDVGDINQSGQAWVKQDGQWKVDN